MVNQFIVDTGANDPELTLEFNDNGLTLKVRNFRHPLDHEKNHLKQLNLLEDNGIKVHEKGPDTHYTFTDFDEIFKKATTDEEKIRYIKLLYTALDESSINFEVVKKAQNELITEMIDGRSRDKEQLLSVFGAIKDFQKPEQDLYREKKPLYLKLEGIGLHTISTEALNKNGIPVEQIKYNAYDEQARLEQEIFKFLRNNKFERDELLEKMLAVDIKPEWTAKGRKNVTDAEMSHKAKNPEELYTRLNELYDNKAILVASGPSINAKNYGQIITNKDEFESMFTATFQKIQEIFQNAHKDVFHKVPPALRSALGLDTNTVLSSTLAGTLKVCNSVVTDLMREKMMREMTEYAKEHGYEEVNSSRTQRSPSDSHPGWTMMFENKKGKQIRLEAQLNEISLQDLASDPEINKKAQSQSWEPGNLSDAVWKKVKKSAKTQLFTIIQRAVEVNQTEAFELEPKVIQANQAKTNFSLMGIMLRIRDTFLWFLTPVIFIGKQVGKLFSRLGGSSEAAAPLPEVQSTKNSMHADNLSHREGPMSRMPRGNAAQVPKQAADDNQDNRGGPGI